jgi:hypothetical protein
MRGDTEDLQELNVRIGEAEHKGDKDFFKSTIAPVLAFRRASGAFVDRITFIDEVKESARRETKIESVNLLGRNTAVVVCLVTAVERDQRKQFHNTRLFVRSNDSAWRLLGWANEPA